jgi:hypothetical protein
MTVQGRANVSPEAKPAPALPTRGTTYDQHSISLELISSPREVCRGATTSATIAEQALELPATREAADLSSPEFVTSRSIKVVSGRRRAW